MLSKSLFRSFLTLDVGFDVLSVIFKYVFVSFNKTDTFSWYSSLSITTTDLPLSAGTIVTSSLFVRSCNALSSPLVLLTVA